MGGTRSTGTPSGYGSAIDAANPLEHIDYRTAKGHVIELWKSRVASDWNRTDLTAAAGTRARAKGDVVGWSHDSIGRQWVVYRATDNHIHALTWVSSSHHWRDTDLTVATHRRTKAASDPTLYIDSVTLTPRPVLVYRGTDHHVHLMIWHVGSSVTAWTDQDVSKAAKWYGKPLGKPSGWASTYPATSRRELHVVFRTANGHVQELYGGFGHAWLHNDLTHISHATVTARSDPQGTVGTDELSQDFEIVAYVGSDHALHKMGYRFFTRIDPPSDHWGDGVLETPVSKMGLWFQNGGESYIVFVGGGHLRDNGRAWGPEITEVNDLTDLTGATTIPAGSTGGYFS